MKKLSVILFFAVFSLHIQAQTVRPSGNKIEGPAAAPLPIKSMPPPPGVPRVTKDNDLVPTTTTPTGNLSVSTRNGDKTVIIPQLYSDTIFIKMSDWDRDRFLYESKYGKLPALPAMDTIKRDQRATSDMFPPQNGQRQTTPPVQKVKN